MTKGLNYIWRVWMVILAGLLLLIFFIPVYILSFRKEYYRYAYFFVRLWCKGVFYGMGFRYEFSSVTPKKIDPKLQYVIIANHTSIIDIFIPVLLFPNHPICFVGKKELVKIPIFGTIYKRICVMVDRSSPKSRAEVYTRCTERMEEGDSVVIFPEGGVPDDTSIILDHFKDGAFVLSNQHQSPIAVLTIIGLKEMFPFNYGKGHPGKIKIVLNDILEPTKNIQETKSYSHNLIKQTLKNS